MASPAVAPSSPRGSGVAALDWPRRRLLGAADALNRIAPSFAGLGITRLARITHLDFVGIPVWTAVRPNGRTLSVSQGKGADDDAARISAAMEAIELAMAEAPIVAEADRSAAELGRDGRSLALLPDLMRRGCPFDPDRQQAWVEGFDLPSGEPLLLPADAVTIDDTAEPGVYRQSTDGLGAGMTLAEALLQGLLEQVERDATVLSRLRSRQRLAASCFPAACLPAGNARAMAECVERAGLRLRLFDITSDLGLPVCTAVLGPRDGMARRDLDVASGTACGFTLSSAAAKAIAEAAQSRLTAIAGLRDDIAPADYGAPVALDAAEDLAAEPPPGAAWPGNAYAAPDGWHDILGRMEAAQLGRCIAVPLSAPVDPFVVAKVFVEGLETRFVDRATPPGPRAVRAMAGLP